MKLKYNEKTKSWVTKTASKTKKTKKMIGLMKNDISGKKMEEFEVLRAKKCSYLTDDNDGSEKGKSTENM